MPQNSTVKIEETELKQMRLGQRAEIHVDSNGTTLRFHEASVVGPMGPLFSLRPPENTGNHVKIVRRIPVKIALEAGENKGRRFRPGMNVMSHVYLR